MDERRAAHADAGMVLASKGRRVGQHAQQARPLAGAPPRAVLVCLCLTLSTHQVPLWPLPGARHHATLLSRQRGLGGTMATQHAVSRAKSAAIGRARCALPMLRGAVQRASRRAATGAWIRHPSAPLGGAWKKCAAWQDAATVCGLVNAPSPDSPETPVPRRGSPYATASAAAPLHS